MELIQGIKGAYMDEKKWNGERIRNAMKAANMNIWDFSESIGFEVKNSLKLLNAYSFSSELETFIGLWWWVVRKELLIKKYLGENNILL